jgi:hypothetical protein
MHGQQNIKNGEDNDADAYVLDLCHGEFPLPHL